MPMAPYPIRCTAAGCDRLAVYKIAARWSDGLTSELKTYGLACEACLPGLLQCSRDKQAACRRAKNEILDSPAVYRLEPGKRDAELVPVAAQQPIPTLPLDPPSVPH